MKYCGRAGLLAAASLCATAVHAGDFPESGEILVTAQKRAEPLAEVPLSVSVLDADRLRERRIVDPAQLDGIVPGFVFTASAGDAPVYTIRGIGFFNESLGAPPAVGVYQDQIPLPFSAMTEGAGLDAERVEVLKGPQGALFGQNATGGAVNFIPARPTRFLSAGMDASYGRFDDRTLGGYVSGPLTGTSATRLAFRVERRDGFRYNYDTPSAGDTGRRNGARRFAVARLLTDWEPRDGFRLQLHLNGWIDRSDTAAKQKIAYAPLTPIALGGYPDSPGYPDLQARLAAYPDAPADNRAAGFDPDASLRRHDSFGQAAARADVDLAPHLAITSISALSRLDARRPNDLDGTIYPDILVTIAGDITSVTQELRLAGATPDERLHWMLGANYEHDSIHDRQQVLLNGTNSGFGPIRFQRSVNINNQRARTIAVFAGFDARIAPTLRLDGALRYTGRRDDFSGCLADPGGPGGIRDAFGFLSTVLSGSETTIPPGACVTLGADDKPVGIVRRALNEDNVSFRAGLSWQPKRDRLLYASVTQGYKAGSFDTLPAIRPAQLGPVRQERVRAYEIGARGNWLDHALQASAALFYYEYRRKQIAGYVDTGVPFGLLPALVSVPKSRVIGADAELHWRSASGLRVHLGAEWLDTKVLGHFETASPLGGLTDIAGESFPNSPRWELTAEAEQHFPIGGRLSAFVGGDVRRRGKTRAAFGGGPLFAVKSYSLVGLRAGVEPDDGRWRLELWGRNILDHYYWTSVEHVEDVVTRLAGMPATWGITLGIRR